MNRASFLAELRMGLSGLPAQEKEETIADYGAHFSEGLAAGRSEAAIAAALGDPARLAKEIRAEAGFRRWESERSAGSIVGAIIALLGLATLDLIFLVPFVCVMAVILIAMFASAVALAFAGGAVWLLAIFPGTMIGASTGMLGSVAALWLAGLGLKAVIGPAVIFDQEAVARHQPSLTPAASGSPRRKSPAPWALRPSRWARRMRTAPLPQAISSRSSSTSPGAPSPSSAVESSALMRMGLSSA